MEEKIPVDMDEFVKLYGRRVRSTVMSFGVRNRDDINDLVQEVFKRMIEKGTLESYDKTGQSGSFVNHVFQVIRTVVLNWVRSKKTRPLDRSVRLEIEGEDGEFLNPEVAEKLLVDSDIEERSVSKMFIEKLFQELDKLPTWETKGKGGRTVKSLTNIAELMIKGVPDKKIALINRVGVSTVSGWRNKIIEVGEKILEKDRLSMTKLLLRRISRNLEV